MTRARSLSKLSNQATFTVDTDNNVGVNSTSPVEKLNVVGVVSATSFFGDGTGLTGVASTDNIITGTAATFNSVVKVGTGITLDATSGIVTATGVNVTGVATASKFDGNATGLTGTPDLTIRNITGVAATFTGVLTYEDVTNIDSLGIITARSHVSIADSILHTGDTDTSIRFPAANVFTIETAGTERFRVLADGTVSSGTLGATPGTIAAGSLVVTNSNAGFFSNVGGDAKFGSSDNNNVLFQVNGSEKVRIATSGQIGLSGANYGTSGQVLTSNGSGSAVTWEDASSGGITTTKYSPTANAIIQIGLGTAQHHELTLSAGFTTITTSGGSFGESHSLVLIQPSSGIATVGFSTYFLFPSGVTPSMSEGSSKVDLVSFVVKDIAGNTGTGATELLASAGLNYS